MISLGGLAELRTVTVTGEALVIGATVTHTELTSNPLVAAHCPVLAEAARSVGDLQVRNRGTIGGTVAFANPGADHITTLAALDATVVLHEGSVTDELPSVTTSPGGVRHWAET